MPFGLLKGFGDGMGKVGAGIGGAFSGKRSKQPGVDESGELRGAAGEAGQFAGGAQDNFARDRTAMRQTEQMLRDRAMGKNSLSAEQLRQGLQQNVAAQRSMAAGARGGGQAAMMRQAMINSARMGAGLSGQQAMAGIAEQNAATDALARLQAQRRQQELNAALGARGQQIQGLGAYEGQLSSRYGADLGVPSGAERAMGLGQGLLSAYMMSDKTKKTDIKDGSDDVAEFLNSLKPYAYKYKDEGNGKGPQVGVMAQDLEKSKAGRQAVVNTPHGKMVDGAKLAGALAASLAKMHKRVEDLESKK